MTTTQDAFIQSLSGDMTPQQAAQLLEMGNGDTGAQSSDEGGQPAATPAASEVTPPADAPVSKTPDPATQVAEPDATNTVLLAKDGKHTIGYEKLVEARDAEKHWRAQAEAAQAQLAQLQAEAQQRANAGQAPTQADNQAAAAQAAIDAGVDASLFGDFSEESLAKGIQSLVDQQVAAKVDAAVKQALAPMEQQKATDAEKAHYQAIYAKHPDADSIGESKELADWITAQPSYLRKAYESVLTQGTTTDIIEMFDHFKSATGVTPAAAKAQPTEAEIKAAAKAAVATSPAQVPTSLTSFPSGRPGAGASPDEAMATMNSHDLMQAMQNMTPQQIEQFLNRQI